MSEPRTQPVCSNLHATKPKCTVRENLVDRTIEPRLNQIFIPLLSIIADQQARDDLRALARRYNQEMIAERGMDTEAQVLEIIQGMVSASYPSTLSIKEITSRFMEKHGNDYERKITSKWIGGIICKKLNLKTYRSRSGFVIHEAEKSKLERLYEKYGIGPKGAPEPAPEEMATAPADSAG